MNCPQCSSSEVEQVNKFDEASIDNDECSHEFECHGCDVHFVITYHAVDVHIVDETED